MAIVINGKKKKSKSVQKDVDADLRALKKKIKRKKQKSKEKFLPAVITKKDQQLLKRSLLKVNSVASMFGQDNLKIQELLDVKENDNAIEIAQRAMLKSLFDILPIAESQYREWKNERAAYAFGALIDKARELISDIQAANDRSIVTDRIIFDILQPTMMTLGQFLIDSNYQLKRDLVEYIEPSKLKEAHKAIDISSKGAATYIQAMFNDLKVRVTKSLGDT